jgi:transposase
MKPKSKGRPKAGLVLTEDELAELRRHARRSTGAQHLALRSKLVLRCATGARNAEVADALDVREATVSKWRGRFVRQRLDGLRDAPRPGGKRRLTDERLEELVRATLELTPKNATHWSTRSMARQLGLNQTMVSRVWRAFGLKPHRTETFSISTDPLFVEKVRDIVGLYMNPPDNALVLCVDEKSQIQALERTQLVLPMMPGVSQRHTHGYFRHGTTTLFAALDTKTGKVIGQCYRRHRATESIAFLARVDSAVPAGLDVHFDHGQLRHTQDTGGEALAREATAVPRPLHADLCVVAQPGRALVRSAQSKETPSFFSSHDGRTRGRHPQLHRVHQRRAEALRLDQDRRRHPRRARPLLLAYRSRHEFLRESMTQDTRLCPISYQGAHSLRYR